MVTSSSGMLKKLSGIGQEGWEEKKELSAGHWTKLNNSVFAEKENKLFLEPPWYGGYSRYHFCYPEILSKFSFDFFPTEHARAEKT